MTTILHYPHKKDYEHHHVSLPSPPDTSSCTSITSSIGDELDSISKKTSVFHLKELPTMNLPENYTIDHSIIQQQQQNKKNNSSRVTWSEKKKNQKMYNVDINLSAIKKRKRSPSNALTGMSADDDEDDEEVEVVEEDDAEKDHKCRDCGKVYKHLNCLLKHQWEHTEQWEYTSSFLLTKHQQVQMLEAASILVNMKKKNRPQLTPANRKRRKVATTVKPTSMATMTTNTNTLTLNT